MRGPRFIVNTGRIVKQIRREAKSHPAKAAVLAVLAVVAVCYWTTLAWSWGFDGKNKSAKPRQQCVSAAMGNHPQKFDPKAILDVELAKINASSNTQGKPRHVWKKIVEWIEEDPRTQAVEKMPGRADAFETPEKPKFEQQAKQDASAPPQKTIFVEPEVTPRELEMSLSSTLVAPGGGVALIDGKAYRIGQTVTSEKDQHKTAFKLSEIHAKHVTLTHKNKKHKLLLPEKKHAGNIQINIKK